ncbi:MAG: LptF/LptG family permease [Myxococcota bacterium]|nr:LptF/LptG family permease [Myxococcota bacterium]
MNTFERYFAKQITSPLLSGLVFFFIIILFGQMVQLSDAVTGLGLDPQSLLNAILFSAAPLLGILLPISALFATMLGVSKLAADGELLAYQATGGQPRKLLKIPIIFSLLLCSTSSLFLVYGEPWGLKSLQTLMTENATTTIVEGIHSKKMIDWIKGITFYAADEDATGLTRVLLVENRSEKASYVVAAEHAEISPSPLDSSVLFSLSNGQILLSDQDDNPRNVIHFEKLDYRLGVKQLVGNRLHTVTHAQMMTLNELWENIQNPETNVNTNALYIVTLNRKFALPVAAVVFSLLAFAIGFRTSKAPQAQAYINCILIIAGYYYLGRALELSARRGDFPPWLAAWVPNILGLLWGWILLWRRGLLR